MRGYKALSTLFSTNFQTHQPITCLTTVVATPLATGAADRSRATPLLTW